MFAVHPGLRAGSRFPVLSQDETQVRAVEWLVWISLGAFAALVSALPDLRLQLPGHAIVRSVLPMTLGLAIAPRHLGGAVMGASGLATGLLLRTFTTHDLGLGALTSMALTGPLLDVVLWRLRSGGWRLYVGIVLAGVIANAAAFLVKLAEKLATGQGKRRFADWLWASLWSYPLFGLAAGLVAAVVFFRWRTATKDVA